MFLKKIASLISVFLIILLSSSILVFAQDSTDQQTSSSKEIVEDSKTQSGDTVIDKVDGKTTTPSVKIEITESQKKIAARLDLIYVLMLAFAVIVISVFTFYVLTMYFGRNS